MSGAEIPTGDEPGRSGATDSNLTWRSEPYPPTGGWVPPAPPNWDQGPGTAGPADGGGDVPPGHFGRKVAATIAALAVLGGVGLAGFQLGTSHPSTPSGSSQTIPSPASSGGPAVNSTAINASKVAAEVDPSVVDVTWTYQGQTSSGTGIILTSSGEVLTNNHVVAGSVQLTVQVAGAGPKYQAKVLGTDVTQDVALIQIEGGSSFRPAKIGNSSNNRVGEPVVAIGNALALPGPPTVTEGAITALNRSITATDSASGLSENLTGMVQIDAPLEPGNSGGPLLDSAGQVIGMNTAADTAGNQSSSSVGFAIPINHALSIASQIQKGQASSTIQIGAPAFLGIEGQNVPPAGSQGVGGYGYNPPVSSGALVYAVIPGTPAASIGLVPGDVITSFDGQSITSVSSLSAAIRQKQPGDSATIGWVGPAGNSHSASFTLASGPAA